MQTIPKKTTPKEDDINELKIIQNNSNSNNVKNLTIEDPENNLDYIKKLEFAPPTAIDIPHEQKLEENTVRSIENFSTGTRGSLCAEHFLRNDYYVIFLHRDTSKRPFTLDYELNR